MRSQIAIREVIQTSKRRNDRRTDNCQIDSNKPIFLFSFFPLHSSSTTKLTQTSSFCVERRVCAHAIDSHFKNWTNEDRGWEGGGGTSKRTNYIRLICARRMLCVWVCMRSAIFFERAHRVGYLRLVFVISPRIFVLPARQSFRGIREEAFNGNAQPLYSPGINEKFSTKSSHRSLIYVSTANGVRACNEHAHARARWSGRPKPGIAKSFEYSVRNWKLEIPVSDFSAGNWIFWEISSILDIVESCVRPCHSAVSTKSTDRAAKSH